MKILKAKQLHPKKQTIAISDLTYNHYYEKYNAILDQGVDKIVNIMDRPIEVVKNGKCDKIRYGANGKVYSPNEYTVLKGSQRVTQAIKLGYTHIEGIVNE